MKFRIALTVLLVAAIAGLSGAQQAALKAPDQPSDGQSDKSSPELDAIRTASQAFVDAFNKADAKAIAALWTEDAQYIDDAGRVHDGRAAIEQAYAEFFEENAGASIRIAIDSIRLLGDNVAIEDGRALVEPPPEGLAGVGQYTAVHVNIEGKWLMASVRDSWVETQVTSQSLADFAWLIGTWKAEEHGAVLESVYRWVADQSFIQRSYTTTSPDGTKTSGVQLIGWNPSQQSLQSWNFSPDGGHAIGIWRPMHGGWSAEMVGVTGEGTPTRSLNRLARLDDDVCVWQSTQRTFRGAALPDTDEIVLKRQPSGR